MQKHVDPEPSQTEVFHRNGSGDRAEHCRVRQYSNNGTTKESNERKGKEEKHEQGEMEKEKRKEKKGKRRKMEKTHWKTKLHTNVEKGSKNEKYKK